MPLNWSTTEKEAVTHGIKCMVHAPSGHGKTTLCGTLPSPLILSAESGLLVLRNKNIPVLKIETYQDFLDAYHWCKGSAEAKQHFASIAMDSVTEIAEVLLAAIKLTVKDPRQAYGQIIEDMLKLVRAFRDIPGFHVFHCYKHEQIKDEGTGIMKGGPMMPGSKLGNQVPYFYDEVFYLGVAKDAAKGTQFRYLQTQPDMSYVAKDRSNTLDMYEKPDMTYIIEKILSGVKKQ